MTSSSVGQGWEALPKGKPMIATCPTCGQKGTVFVRSEDGSDLVCKEDA